MRARMAERDDGWRTSSARRSARARRRRLRGGSAGRPAQSRPTRSSAATPSTCTSGPTPRSCAPPATCPSEPSRRRTRASDRASTPAPRRTIRTRARSSTRPSGCRPASPPSSGWCWRSFPSRSRRPSTAASSGWQRVSAPGRRRQWYWDGAATLAVSIASTSDLDDVIPTAGGVPDRVEQAARLDRVSRPDVAALLAREAPPDERRPGAPRRAAAAAGRGLGAAAADLGRPALVRAPGDGGRPEGRQGPDARRHPRRVRAAGGPLVAADRELPGRARPAGAAGLLRLLEPAQHREPALGLRPAPRRDALALPGGDPRRRGGGRDRGAAAGAELQQPGERALLRRPALARQPRRRRR